jgi:hypothetical protein
MPLTYIKIASVTVGSGGTSAITFSNIPNTYTDLVCLVSHRSSNAVSGSNQGLGMKINGVTTNRTYRRLEGYDSVGASTDAGTGALVGLIQGSSTTASTFASFEVYIPNYAGSTNKSFSTTGVTENNASSGVDQHFIAQLWSQTTAIDSIEFYNSSSGSDTFVQYSTATLYGISKS